MENMSNPQKLIVIIGPTASGKTDLALKLAKKFHGEIISADSRQVYRGMDIGTGKVKKLHHVIDVANPKRTFTVAKWKKHAQDAIQKLIRSGKLPMVVGGTGFYIEALLYDLPIPEVKPNLKLRRKLEKLSTEQLFKKLRKLDPRRAKTIDKQNKRRLIRALEIINELGKVPPASHYSHSSLYDPLVLALKIPNNKLRKRINKRVDARVSGIIREIKKLRSEDVSFKRLINLGLEYRYFSWHLMGKLSRKEAIDQLKTATWQFARRQRTYFKHLPVHWIKNQRDAETKIRAFLMN